MLSKYFNDRRPAGFTLVELLVVMTIISVLMSLIMSGIINVRQTALRSRCTNNQKELALAILSYEISKTHLPYWNRLKSSTNYSWVSQVLEQLGEGKLATLYDENRLDPNVSKITLVPLPIVKCPAGDATQTGLSYVVNCGSEKTQGHTSGTSGGTNRPTAAVIGSGLFFKYFSDASQNYKSTTSSIKDGASNTIMLTESLYKHGKLNTEWAKTANAVTKVGLLWNTSLEDKNEKTPNNYQKNLSYFADSNHANTDIYAFADNSVRSINKRIYYRTYSSLMAPNDKDAGIPESLEVDPNLE
ncbi:MAG: DUF1559 domain-containing protein [Planctomycetia bacterium]|nr:DUF1559 domain-containing protein [Planctomycetia bacterium]